MTLCFKEFADLTNVGNRKISIISQIPTNTIAGEKGKYE